MTYWTGDEQALIGAQCEYANAPVNSITDPVLAEYLRTGFHCAIGDSNPAFGRGENCGKCYKLTSLGGKKGSAEVMVSNGGAGGSAHFDCMKEAYNALTGAAPGRYDVEFDEVKCSRVAGNPVIINWADKNAYYCKMMFENVGGWGGLKKVTACIGGSCNDLSQFSGATWTGCPKGEASSTEWTLTQEAPGGAESQIKCHCDGHWPWENGQRCTCQGQFAVSEAAEFGSTLHGTVV